MWRLFYFLIFISTIVGRLEFYNDKRTKDFHTADGQFLNNFNFEEPSNSRTIFNDRTNSPAAQQGVSVELKESGLSKVSKEEAGSE